MKKSGSGPAAFYVSVVLLCCILIFGVWAVFSLAGYERKRDLNSWMLTLGVMADSRANSVHQWADGRFATLRELADNGSLQLYVQQLVERPEENRTAEPVELSYLRNLLVATAQRGGFESRQGGAPLVQANVAFHADNGIVIFSPDSRIVTATPGVTLPDPSLKKAVREVVAGGKQLFFGMHLNANNQPVAGFLVPIFALQKQSDRQQPIAVLYGFQNAVDSLFPLLSNAGFSTETTEALLVRQENDLILYLSPLADNTPALKRSLSADTEHLISAHAVQHPGQFGSGSDYAGKECLFTSRKLDMLGWTLVQKISTAEALAESNTHQRFLLVTLLMALLVGASLMVAAWWHGTSIRERKAAGELSVKSGQLEAQTILLNAINDNMTDYVMLLDHEKQLIFANRALAEKLSLSPVGLQGKGLRNVFGPENFRQLEIFISETESSGKVVTGEVDLSFGEDLLVFQVCCLQIRYEHDGRPATLLTLNDVTILREAQIRKERLMQQIIAALMRAIDLHDPHSANHSGKTAQVAEGIALAMGLDSVSVTTLKVAANLCNLGKLSIPRELLLKTSPLTDEEQDILRRETLYATEILADIDFDGPVQQTIAQKNELLDGAGYPNSLQGDEIILTARILSAANSFVAMISPRAYREKLTITDALDQLLRLAGEKYDRKVIAALAHVIENKLIGDFDA
ncbi:MAG: hypothetical protein BM485_01025 [Desulfobulbaceae bacterium DB1]|nr:MAG: hypothetical protein BM485_01025 [Desulfobulbaceae bacterium DB1]